MLHRFGPPMTFALAAVLLGPPGTLKAQSGETRQTLVAGGVARSYLLFVPSGYAVGRPLPVVLVFHGGGSQARAMTTHTQFTRVAERERFAVVYPEGLDGRWNDGRRYGASHDDVAFVRALLDTLSRRVTLDTARVYATGISNGAMFAIRLACDLPGVFAAIAPVAGAVPAALAERCAAAAPVAVAAFQGTADPLLPYAGGGGGAGGPGGGLFGPPRIRCCHTREAGAARAAAARCSRPSAAGSCGRGWTAAIPAPSWRRRETASGTKPGCVRG